jgi:A/G-specific adenine glycosylase
LIDTDRLKRWFLDNRRDLAFRKNRDPYRIWVSEIMLQQTQVDVVIPYFRRFLEAFPSVSELSNAEPDHVRKMTEGLGYYRRFRLMHEASKAIMDVHDGQFPKTYADVRALPGVGEYTAGAIMSIAYGKPYAATDGNVIRVIARHEGLTDDMRQPKSRKKVASIHQHLIERSDPAIHSEAMMELGALVCTPKRPLCETCPLNGTCAAYRDKMTGRIPFMSKRPEKETTSYVTFILEQEDAYVMRRRTESLLHGMYEWPQYEAESVHSVLMDLEREGIVIEITEPLPEVTHVFTHRIWHMRPYRARLVRGMKEGFELVRKDRLSDKPMAVAHSKILKPE